MSAAKAWAFYDAVHAHSGGCQVCGDDDEFSPNAEAFEETGEIMCGDCWETAAEAPSPATPAEWEAQRIDAELRAAALWSLS